MAKFSCDCLKASAFASTIFLPALFGCHNVPEKPDILWSTQAYSPDKHYLAIAEREAGGSFGGGYAVTTVSIKQNEQKPTEILGVDRLIEKSDLQLVWTSSEHLKIVIDTHTSPLNPSELFFQAIKYASVTIELTTASSSNAVNTR